ncbi:MAG TPA: protein kinase [Thermoleophilaceae bacterium]
MSELVLESTFAGCRIEEVAGRGGMGIVYRATQLPIGRAVALKVVAPERAADPTFHARFERETRVAVAIDHPNVIPVYEAGESEGRLYLVMRWVEGGDLQDQISASDRLDPRYAAEVVAQVAAGLDAAHAAGLVHRDVKPANVLIASPRHVYLTDFGLTLEPTSSPRITRTGEWIGTAEFMAPEQFEGDDVGPRTDVYALGCVLHMALTGRPPFARQTVTATMLAHLRDSPPLASATPGVPKAFDEVVAQALAKRPDERYRSAGELGEAALAAAGAPAPAEAVPEPVTGNGHSQAATLTMARPTIALPEAAPAPTARLNQPRERATSRALLMASGVLALAAGIVALLLLLVDPLRPGGSSGPLTKADVRSAVDSFARAYAREDDDALSDVLTSDVSRVTPGDSERGRRAVLREYRQQFAANRTTGYKVSGLELRGGKAGRASGSYVATRSGAGPITGRIAFGVRRDHGHARIGLIAVTPDR